MVAWQGVIWCVGMFWACSATANHANIAVATNFRIAAGALADAYAKNSEHQITMTTGSTGKLYAQIVHGAPFDLFMAADQQRPIRLVEAGLAVPESQYTFALGYLVLIGHKPVTLDTLRGGHFRTLAIANPKLAPYGLAALQTLQSFGLNETMRSKIVLGENVGQAYAMFATGNADLALVASSMTRVLDLANTWPVPASHHEPVRQDLVLLNQSANNSAAIDFIQFVRSSAGRTIIHDFGYGTPIHD